jgi:hypothetical protein
MNPKQTWMHELFEQFERFGLDPSKDQINMTIITTIDPDTHRQRCIKHVREMVESDLYQLSVSHVGNMSMFIYVARDTIERVRAQIHAGCRNSFTLA